MGKTIGPSLLNGYAVRNVVAPRFCLGAIVNGGSLIGSAESSLTRAGGRNTFRLCQDLPESNGVAPVHEQVAGNLTPMHHSLHRLPARAPRSLCIVLAVLALLLNVPCVEAAPRIKVLFLGDNGHHRPAERFRQLQPVLDKRGIDLTYTDK